MDCPACGSPLTLDVGPGRPRSTSLSDALLAANEDERIEVTRNCWDCGWHEMRQIRVESVEIVLGDDAVVERAALLDESTDELAAIDRVTTLEDTLAELRRRRSEPSTTGSPDGSAE